MSVAREVLEQAVSAARDNLCRAEITESRNPEWLSGNGETIQSVVAQYRARLRELEKTLGELAA